MNAETPITANDTVSTSGDSATDEGRMLGSGKGGGGPGGGDATLH